MTTERQKFKIYVRHGGRLKVKAKPRPRLGSSSSAVAFVLRHISGRIYEDAVEEANRLLNIVDHTPADRAVIEQVLQSRCRQKSQ